MMNGTVKQIDTMESEMDAEGHAPAYHDQLPSVEEVRAFSVQDGSKRKRRMFFRVLVLVVLIGIVVGVSVGVVNKNNNQSSATKGSADGPTTNEGTSTPTEEEGTTPPTSAPGVGEPLLSDRMEDVVEYLSQFPNAASVNTEGTPQYRAAKWIADEDALSYDIPTVEGDNNFRFLQRYALAVLYYSTNGENWTNQRNFLTDTEECNWYDQGQGNESFVHFGVKCLDDGEIESIVLENNNLVGQLPPELGFLTKLDDLWVPNNTIEGTLPVELRKLDFLDTLNLDNNMLTGEIPAWMKHWTKLTVLSLRDNKLKGTIPTEIGLMGTLQRLMLDGNELNGEIPSELRHVDSLVKISLANNRLQGELSTWFTNSFANLLGLKLSNNLFTGTLPDALWDLSLEVLDLHGNNFTGGILPEQVTEGNALLFLDLHDNHLNHTIPSAISSLTKLKHLDLSANELSGEISFHLGDLTDLEYLFLGNNTFKSAPIVDSLEELKNLRELSLRRVGLTEQIPDWIANLDKLSLLDLSNNTLTGNIPDSLGNLASLKYLIVSQNLLDGTVPSKGDATEDSGYLCDGTDLNGALIKVFADCGGNPEINCSCCTCCEGGAATCTEAQIDPDWETGYVSVATDYFENKLAELFRRRNT